MSVDLGTTHWQLAGVIDGWAMLTSFVQKQSRWVDLRSWPPKLYPKRDEWTRAVCAGATLAGWKTQSVFTYVAPDKRRTERALPAKFGYRAIGMLDGRVVVVPGFLGVDNHSSPQHVARAPMMFDREWRTLDGEGGSDTTTSAIVGDLVIWSGRVFRWQDELVPVDLEVSGRDFIPTDDGFVCLDRGKLVVVTRHGKQREDRALGVDRVLRYEGRYLVWAKQYWLYDLETRSKEPFDIGVPSVGDLIAAPCGLVALDDDGRYLIPIRV